MKNSAFANIIIKWYSQHQRDLPWRNTLDPYRIWLSEIILQQTRVNQGMPYYLKFVDQYPDVIALASAPQEEVLRLWQGLGYYSRARNLHRCAQIVANEHEGQFPNNYSGLLKLPGIGPYTAAAIASIVADEPVPVVDGNVLRLASRYFGIEKDIANAKTQAEIRELLSKEIHHVKPSMFNQGMMEMGSLQCTPKKPNCDDCPLQQSCVAYKNDLQSTLPIKVKKLKRKSRYFYYLLLRHETSIAMQLRSENDIWKNLYEFILIENGAPVEIENLSNKLLSNILKSGSVIKNIKEERKHVLSHQDIFATFVQIDLNTRGRQVADAAGIRFYSPQEIEKLPKSVLIDKFWQKHIIDYI